jgi:hypothetical protein
VVWEAQGVTNDLSLFPLLPETKTPALAWDAFKTGQRRASDSELAGWAAQRYNLAVATGEPSGCVILDCDSWEAWAIATERDVPDTYTVKTPRGWHFYFQHPGGYVGNRAKLGGVAGWDIRGDGGYVVAPGSHYTPSEEDAAKGKVAGPYFVENDVPMAPAPAWLLDLLKRDVVAQPIVPHSECEQTTIYGQGALNGTLRDLSEAVQGQNLSHQIYVSSARVGELVGGGEVQYEQGWESLLEGIRAHVGDEEKALGTMLRGWEKGWANPKSAPERTILTAEAAFGQRGPLVEGEQPVDVPEPPSSLGPVKREHTVTGEPAYQAYFAGCAFVIVDDAIWVPGGVMLKRSAFDAVYGGPTFYLDAEGSKNTRSAWEAFRTTGQANLPIVYQTIFRPELAPNLIKTIEGMPALNAYTPIHVPTQEGDASRFVAHVHKMLPDGQDAEYLLHWMASCVQNPGKKFQWWPVIQGTKGNGKGLLLNVMMAAIGGRYSHLVNPEAMQKTGNQFNAWLERKLFLGFDEIRTGEGQRHFIEMMKETVTSGTITVEGKGQAQRTADNRANGMMLTNWKDAVPVDSDERRWGMFWCAQQDFEHLARDGMGGSYFTSLYDWLRDQGGYAIVTNYLKTRPLVATMDPARDLQRCPETTSTAGARAQSLGNLEQEVADAIEEERPGFTGGFVSSFALKGLFATLRTVVGPKKHAGIMKNVGYILHPRLPAGRLTAAVNGQKPRVYVRADDAYLMGLDASQVVSAFEQTANGAPTISNVVAFPPRA